MPVLPQGPGPRALLFLQLSRTSSQAVARRCWLSSAGISLLESLLVQVQSPSEILCLP